MTQKHPAQQTAPRKAPQPPRDLTPDERSAVAGGPEVTTGGGSDPD